MHSLITGGAGFIGSHLTDRLLAAGDRVTILDDLSTGALANLSAAYAHDARRVTVVRGSVLDAGDVERLVRDADRVFHLAAVVGVRAAFEQPLRAVRVNVHGSERVLTAAADGGVPTVLFSSSEVYGSGEEATAPLREDAPLEPGRSDDLRGSYACSKAMAEWIGTALAAERGLDLLTVRLFNTTGPRQCGGAAGMVVPRFVGHALRGEALTVYGDGRQTRCFAAVGEVVDAIVALASTRHAWGRTFNVGSAREVSIDALARTVRDVTGCAVPIEHVPFERAFDGPRFSDVRRRLPDLSRLRAAIGWVPDASLEQLVADVVRASREPAPVGPSLR